MHKEQRRVAPDALHLEKLHKEGQNNANLHQYLCSQEEQRRGVAWDGKLMGVLDLRGITLSNCDSAALLTIFRLLQNHYVERLHRMYLYAAPSIFYGVWAVVKPFVSTH